jgi:hypothetical protein
LESFIAQAHRVPLHSRTDETLQRDVEAAMQPATHFQRGTALLGQDFENSPASVKLGFKILARDAKLIHQKVDGLDQSGWTNGITLRFIRLNERR